MGENSQEDFFQKLGRPNIESDNLGVVEDKAGKMITVDNHAISQIIITTMEGIKNDGW